MNLTIAQAVGARLDRIEQLTEQLAKVRDDAVEQLDLAERINREIHAARLVLNELGHEIDG